MSFEWHRHKCLNFPGATVVPFSVFSEWIGKQATWRIAQHLEQSGQSQPLSPHTPPFRPKSYATVHTTDSEDQYHDQIETAYKTAGCRSFSRTCPVKIRHPSTKQTVEGLAVLDDQSSMTFLGPSALQQLQIPDAQLQSGALTTITIEGVSAKRPCQYLKNLQVSPIDGSKTINIASSVIQNEIPHSITDVPEIEDVQSHSGARPCNTIF